MLVPVLLTCLISRSCAGVEILSWASLETARCGGKASIWIPAHPLAGCVAVVYYITRLASVSLRG